MAVGLLHTPDEQQSTHQQPVTREPILLAEVAANRTEGPSLILLVVPHRPASFVERLMFQMQT